MSKPREVESLLAYFRGAAVKVGQGVSQPDSGLPRADRIKRLNLGEALGSGAFLSALRRSKNGGFELKDAVNLQDALEMLA